MSEHPKVVCAGVITIDVIAVVPSFPAQEGRMLADSVVITGGGPASNAAVVLARQGISVAVVGRVGADESGRQAIALLAAEGVDVSGIEVDPDIQTQTSVIIVDQPAGTRSIVTTGANPLPELSGRAKELVAGAQWLHVDHLGYEAAVAACSKLNIPPLVSLDSGNAPIANLDLSKIDLYVPTVETLIAEAGTTDADEAARSALDAGCLAVVATRGSEGSTAWWGDHGAPLGGAGASGRISAPAFEGATIISTLGAGDVFHGGLLSALIHGHDWETALERANTTAALSCEGVDGRQAVPTTVQLDAALVQR